MHCRQIASDLHVKMRVVSRPMCGGAVEYRWQQASPSHHQADRGPLSDNSQLTTTINPHWRQNTPKPSLAARSPAECPAGSTAAPSGAAAAAGAAQRSGSALPPALLPPCPPSCTHTRTGPGRQIGRADRPRSLRRTPCSAPGRQQHRTSVGCFFVQHQFSSAFAGK